MSNYNLITSGLVISNTASGTGNKELSAVEINSLYNGNTTSSGVVLLSTDILYLDIDFFRRVSAKDFKLFISTSDRVEALAGIDFYYKGFESDDYVLCNKAQDSFAFYPIDLPELFTPRFFRVVIDSVVCSLFEINMTNDDTQVSFGEDGTQSLVNMNQQVDSYTVLPIFNNSVVGSLQVNAYILVEYMGRDSDFFLTLSATPDGEYKGLKDGAFVSTADLSFKYNWLRGNFQGTYVDADKVKVDPASQFEENVYFTPVVDLGDPFMSSYLITVSTATISGISITWDETANKPIAKIRSSNTAPIPFAKFFITIATSSTSLEIYEGDLNSGKVTMTEAIVTTSSSSNSGIIFDRLRGSFVIVENNNYLYRYEYGEIGLDGIIKTSSSSSYNSISDNWSVDGQGNVWGYQSGSGFRLRVFNSISLASTNVVYDATLTFLTDLAADLRYPSCWYTNPSVKMVIHIEIDGTQITTKSLDNPTYITALYDGGCLVVDAGDSTIVRLDYFGEVIKEISYTSTLIIKDISYNINEETSTIYHERFWVLTEVGDVYQYSFDGEVISTTKYISASSIHAFLGGCLVHSSSLNKTYQLNSDGVLTRLWDYNGLGTIGKFPNPINMSYSQYLTQYESAAVLPLRDDPVWGTAHEDGWLSVIDNGYQLPFAQYHQIKYKFNNAIHNNLLINGDFETGDATGWTVTGVPYFLSGHGSSYSFSLPNVAVSSTITAYQMIDLNSISGIDFDILDNLDFNKTSTYYFTLDYWTYFSVVSYSYLNGYIYYEYYTEAGDLISNSKNYMTMGAETNWINEIMVSKLLSGTRKIKVYFYFNKSRYTDSYYAGIDDINAKITLSPSLDIVGVPEPVKLVDIMPQTSRNLYLKTEFPVNSVESEYETQLKCWWGNWEA